MSETWKFIARLESLKQGDRAQLRCLAGRNLDQSLITFDLFTGTWWPLRNASSGAPRRETAWLVAKLFCSFRIPNVPDGRHGLPIILGAYEPSGINEQRNYRSRFDALLQSPFSGLEPHIRWALQIVDRNVNLGLCPGLNWANLVDELSIWDRGDMHRLARDIRDIWAEQYSNVVRQI